mmetsp:Transcript_5591/g.8156  ORF Transcript_5591/g.8156 Transcript_5591/m.8156 type:complete len:709 (-) Transcript_5591:127-2253(-)
MTLNHQNNHKFDDEIASNVDNSINAVFFDNNNKNKQYIRGRELQQCKTECDANSVYVCHFDQPLCVNKNALYSHLSHGDACCVDACCSNCPTKECISTTPPVATPAPIAATTPSPTKSPTKEPTDSPTVAPTKLPTTFPPTSKSPTVSPTKLPTTASPTNLPTASPTTASPTDLPTASPTDLPTASPSTVPTASPSSVPTASPTVTPGSPTMEPTIPLPSSEPSISPTFEPSAAPSYQPSVKASSMPSPTPGSPTMEPTISKEPSASPTASPSTIDSNIQPTASDSSEDVGIPVQQSLQTENVEMRITGVSQMEASSAALWGTLTGRYVRQEILQVNGGDDSFEDLRVNLSLVRQAEVDENGRLLYVEDMDEDHPHERNLNTILVIVYDVNVALVSMIDIDDLERYVTEPFDTADEQDQFIRDLKATGDPAFAAASAVSVTLPKNLGRDDDQKIDQIGGNGDGGNNNGNGNMGLVIGIALVGTMIVALVGILIHRRMRRNGDGSGSKKSNNDTQPISQHVDPTNNMMNGEQYKYVQEINVAPTDDISTLGEPIGLFGDHITTTDETATIDYDYKRLLKGSQSVAGDSTNLNSILGEMTEITSGIYIDKLVEDRVDVDAPPGNLGLIIDAGEDGCPFVCEVKDSSVLYGKVLVGDRLLSVDGVDLTIMRTGDVYKVIASKKEFPVRKFVFARARQSGASKSTDSQGWGV